MFRWFRRTKAEEQPQSAEQQPDGPTAGAECQHTVLTPRWDALEDMGKPERATAYRCENCGAVLSRDEGRALIEQGAQLL